MEHRMITVREAAELAQVDPKTVRRWYREGVVRKFQTPGGRVFVDAAEILARITPEPVEAGS